MESSNMEPKKKWSRETRINFLKHAGMYGLTKQERGDLVAWMRLSTSHEGLDTFCSKTFGEPKNPNYKLCKKKNKDR
jgi:hypothetical protein